MSNPTELPNERAEFESAQHKYHWPLAEADLRQDKIGNYYNHVTQANWSMWQARAALARRAQPEGEAPQAEAYEVWNYAHECWETSDKNGYLASHEKNRRITPVPTLSPLCGAQQAAAPGALAAWFDAEQKRLDAVSAYNAVALAAEREIWPGRDINPEFQAMNTAQNAEFHARAALFASRASAPGTPEAPDWEGFAMAVLVEARDNLGSDVDGGMIQEAATDCGLLVKVVARESCGENCVCADFDTFPQDCYRYSKGALKAIRNEAQRAAQLDGGQKGSAA